MISILYQDSDLLVIDKPSGVLSQGTVDPKREHISSLLQKQLNCEVFLHHRLDKDTSGIMIFALSKKANPGLTEMFRQHTVKKTYLSICKINRIPEEKEFTVRNFLAPVRSPEKKMMRMVSVKKGGWEAITDFKILDANNEFAFIEAKPKTGRTHQIRIHLAEMKLPILGDPLYGGKSSLVPRTMLHAYSLDFQHPVTQAHMSVRCPLPQDMKKVLENLKFKSDFASVEASE